MAASWRGATRLASGGQEEVPANKTIVRPSDVTAGSCFPAVMNASKSSRVRRSPRPCGGLRIVVLGYLVRGPVGGMAWSALQYVIGLRRLGHDVLFVEDSGDSPWCCYDPARGVVDADPTYGVRYATEVCARFGLMDAWAYWDAHTSQWLGPRARGAAEFCRSADVALNISGINQLRDWTAAIPRRVFIDSDPAFTQIKHLTDEGARAAAHAHNVFLSFGAGIGQPGCTVPDDGLPWRPTRQPVVLDLWPVTAPSPGAPFTTVMQWESYPEREFAGLRYGTKAMSFAPYLDLPQRVAVELELALGTASAPREGLRMQGWRVVNPLEVALYPWDFRDYVQRSTGEFGVAKHGYVVSRSGWFGERSAAYLASGRPAIVQETGFSSWLPAGAGLIAFSTPEEAVQAFEAVAGDPVRHRRAARGVAETHFESGMVLSRLLEDVTAAPGTLRVPG